MKENLNALDELNKGATMGVEATKVTIEYVKDKGLKDVLVNQCAFYEAVSDKVKDIYKTKSSKKPHKISAMNKMMVSSGINMKLMKDKTSSKIAELLINGTTMGIIEGRRMLNDKSLDSDISKLIGVFVKAQEEYVETLKTYL